MKSYKIEEILVSSDSTHVVLICSDESGRIFGFRKFDWLDPEYVYGKKIGDTFNEGWFIFESLLPIAGIYNDIDDIKRNI